MNARVLAGPLSTRAVILMVIAMMVVSVAATAINAAVRGNQDTAPALFNGIGVLGAPEAPDGARRIPANSGACPPATAPVKKTPATDHSPTRCAPTSAYAQTSRIGTVLPDGWSVEQRSDEELVLVGPHAIVDVSQRDAGDSTGGNLADDALAQAQRRHPDAILCHPAVPASLDNGPSGQEFALCYTAVPQVGAAVATDQVVAQALVIAPGKATQLFTETAIYADADGAAAADEIDPVLRSLYWKQFSRQSLSIN